MGEATFPNRGRGSPEKGAHHLSLQEDQPLWGQGDKSNQHLHCPGARGDPAGRDWVPVRAGVHPALWDQKHTLGQGVGGLHFDKPSRGSWRMLGSQHLAVTGESLTG